MTPGPANGLAIAGGHGGVDSGKDDDLPSLEELPGVGGAQVLRREGTGGQERMEWSDGVLAYPPAADCTSAPARWGYRQQRQRRPFH